MIVNREAYLEGLMERLKRIQNQLYSIMYEMLSVSKEDELYLDIYFYAKQAYYSLENAIYEVNKALEEEEEEEKVIKLIDEIFGEKA